MTGLIIHPAVLHVARCEELWTNDKGQAMERAHIIVRRLVEWGYMDESEFYIRQGVVYRSDVAREAGMI